MKKLFFTIFILFAFALGAYAQPLNRSYELVADTLSNPQDVSISDVQDLDTSLPANVCLYEVLNGETRYYYLVNVAPGPHAYRVRVFYEERTTTNPDGSTTVHPADWSGWSNTVTGTKPQVLGLSIVDGYLVTAPQPGVVATKVYIKVGDIETEYAGLTELSPDNQYLRLYNVTQWSEGSYEIWSNAAMLDSNGSQWEGDYQANPFVVTIAPASPAPANLRIRAQ